MLRTLLTEHCFVGEDTVVRKSETSTWSFYRRYPRTLVVCSFLLARKLLQLGFSSNFILNSYMNDGFYGFLN